MYFPAITSDDHPPGGSADAAARVLQEYFLANSDRGDHAANDKLVAELDRAGQYPGAIDALRRVLCHGDHA